MNKHTVSDSLAALFAAADAGKAAFLAGKTSVPALDPACMALIDEGAAKTIHILKSWSAAWHRANIAALA